jgi:signal transduction histidine kinase/CheY-like chemotaxis protein
MDSLTLAIEAVFGLVFIAAVLEWWRRRDVLSRDVVFVFGSLIALFLISLLGRVVDTLPTSLAAVAVVALLAQPGLTLKVAADIRPIPRPVLVAATAAWALTALPFAFLGTGAPRPLLLGAVAAFVIVEAVAAAYLAGTARRRAGAAAVRLWIAAAATALFSTAILAAGAGSSGGGDSPGEIAARVLALLAALGYLAAFAPPAFLRRLLQAHTAYAGLRKLLAASDEAPENVWQRFLAIAAGATGAVGGYVVADAPEGDGREIVSTFGLEDELVGRPLPEGTGQHADDESRDGDLSALASVEGMSVADRAVRESGARFGRVIRLGSDPSAPTLALFSTHRSLFGDEDRVLLTALGQQASGIVEYFLTLRAQRRLSIQLGDTVSALRTASQAKSDFLASMSHELRTPLNAIIGFSDLMRREPVDEDGNVLVPLEWVEHVRSGGTHLVELVNDVLDLSKVEAGRLELDREPVEVQLAVRESVAGLRPLADRKDQAIQVAIESGEHVTADRGRLRQILYNLLSNAIKFTPRGGQIRVEGQRVGGEYHLSVTDSGVGIAPEDQAAVFEEFRQVGHGGQRSEGTGLGLALTRRLVEAHEGRIELRSTPGSGSRFTVVLPSSAPDALADRDREPGAVIPGLTPTERPASVLVIEDDPSAVRLLNAYLEPEGYAVRVASDGEQALKAVRQDRPAAILLDVLLPGIDGWEVLRRLKGDPELRDIPVVIVTVVDEKDVGLALGAVDYLVKPINREALLTSLSRLSLTPKAKARTIRVLAVDDEPAALDMLTETLLPAGFDVVRAVTGVSAIQIARAERPDLVICDLVMPDLDGFGVVAALKADPATADIPIIILTGHDLTAADKRRLNGKVVRIVAKGSDAQAGLRAWLVRAAPLVRSA